jgi:hypothetical protein
MGDFYILTSGKKAAGYYERAWRVMDEAVTDGRMQARFFGSPVLLQGSTRTPVLPKRPKNAADNEPLFLVANYTVNAAGRVKDVTFIAGNVTNNARKFLRGSLMNRRYRPRIEEGNVTVTRGLQYRQLFLAQ